ncbi:membrane protein [Mycobacterium tuberculosis]|nr:membrane protein [Mycobacterium tuberculosis]CKO02427.1 membrane protein [Mycobacterium tuberculosis]
MRTWIPLVILVVVIVGGFTVHRIRGFFGSENRPSYSDTNLENSKPFNPKHLTYEIFGPPGTVADISYFDVNPGAATGRWSGATVVIAYHDKRRGGDGKYRGTR